MGKEEIADTICAPATASGGAIGIIRVSGSRSLEILSRIFTKDLTSADPNIIHYGHIMDGKDVVDEVLVSVFRAPHSYTGEDGVEISCHGSRYILNKVLELLQGNGCRMARPGEFTQRAFLNGKMDLSQAEAVADLIASQNAAQHRVAMSQMRGGISTKLKDLRDRLLNLTALLELELDFADHEDLEFADRSELQHLAEELGREILLLSASFAEGNAIKNGIPVAIIGAPNVGKSTLLNALLCDDRAIVSDIQGTTRDLIEDTVTINGHLFRIIDTAGIRHTDDTIERMGIERSRKAAEKAQIVILLTEDGVPFPDIEVKEGQTILHVINKCDKTGNGGQSVVPEEPDASTHLEAEYRISALTGNGMDNLEHALLNIATLQETGSSEEHLIITNQRHKQALDLAYADITRVLSAMQQKISGDLIAEDLRQCIDHLSDILGGTITTHEVLGTIFSKFCVGK